MKTPVYLCEDHYSPHLETIATQRIDLFKCDVAGCGKNAAERAMVEIDEHGLGRITYDIDLSWEDL